MEASFWRIEKSLTAYLILLFLAASFISTFLGTTAPVTQAEAEEIYKEFAESSKYISTAQFIFGNNFLHCLLMFIPAVGPPYGLYVMYNTGIILKMLAVAQGIDVFVALLGIFIFPFAWMEYVAYALAMSQSVSLLRRFLKREAKSELIRTCVWITLCAIILLVAAVMEALLIAHFEGTLGLPPK